MKRKVTGTWYGIVWDDGRDDENIFESYIGKCWIILNVLKCTFKMINFMLY